MPWCEGCSRFLNPNTLRPDGTCPTCERQVADPEDQVDLEGREERKKAPWHFKLLVAVTVVYLGFRLIQMTVWGIQWLLR